MIAAGLFTALPTAAQSFSIFDDFSSSTIDGGRWSGFAGTVRFYQRAAGDPNSWNNETENPLLRHPEFSTYNVSALRRILAGRLQLRLESVGGMHPDPAVLPGYGRIGVSDRGGSYSAVRVTVRPMVARAPACGVEGESRVRAMLSASIRGSVPDIDTFVSARLMLERSSFGGDRIHGVLSRCRVDWACAVAEDLARVDFDRAWTLGAAHTLTIRYEPATGTVVFVVGGGGVAAEMRTLRVPVPDNTALISGVALRVQTVPSNCPPSGDASAGRIEVTMDARFDDVRVAEP